MVGAVPSQTTTLVEAPSSCFSADTCTQPPRLLGPESGGHTGNTWHAPPCSYPSLLVHAHVKG